MSPLLTELAGARANRSGGSATDRISITFEAGSAARLPSAWIASSTACAELGERWRDLFALHNVDLFVACRTHISQ